jgi:hypothetical protein
MQERLLSVSDLVSLTRRGSRRARRGSSLALTRPSGGFMITRFHFKGRQRVLRFDYLGPPWIFFFLVLFLERVLSLVLVLIRFLS